jgi:hypothetical protein
MTYSQFQFLPLQVIQPLSSQDLTRERYRLLKFTDARDPRHKYLYPLSGSMIENYESQSKPRKRKHINEDGSASGRLLDMNDNWCLLPRNNITSDKLREAPHPHRGHPVLYIPGHWGSFSQSRSLGAHGTRWTGPYTKTKSDQEIYESLLSGRGMHDGLGLLIDGVNVSSSDDVMAWLTSTKFQQQRQNYLSGFVMDVFALDFDGEGAALHSSSLVRQADFFSRAVQTIVKGCHLHPNDHPHNDVNSAELPLNIDNKRLGGGITIVAHSIGAWVVRVAMKRHPTLFDEGYIRNIVTLASPLGSIPYSVDAGVHHLEKELNNGVRNAVGADFTMISISGGLRDEMIPPEVCEVPNNLDNESTRGVVSSAILASSIVKKDSTPSTANDRFGMDHRAIVWCFDLLKEVREVVFSLAVATDNGLVSSERMDVALRIMNGEHDNIGVGSTRNETHSTYQEQVNNQQLLLLRVKGYWRTVAIQLSALYHLNTLLKLCISAALLDAYLIPYLHYLRGDQTITSVTASRSMSDRCLNIALGLLVIPSVAVMVAWTRQFGPWKSCHAQECHLLLGTMFTLSQVATTCYYLIVHGAFALLALISIMLTPTRTDFMDKSVHAKKTTFWGLFFQLSVQQLCPLALLFFPLTVFTCFIANIFIFGNEDLVWNIHALASYSFITLLIHNLVYLIAAACQRASPLSFGNRRSEIIVIILSMVKDACGKVLYAFSLTTQWGQTEVHSYSTWVFAAMAFAASAVFRTHDAMAQNFASYWKQTKMNAGNGDTATGSSHIQLDTLNSVALQSRFVNVTSACLACFFTWNVSRNDGVLDDIMIPIYTSIVVIETYLKCLSYSYAVIDACSAITNNELLLHCDSPKNHDKNE